MKKLLGRFCRGLISAGLILSALTIFSWGRSCWRRETFGYQVINRQSLVCHVYSAEFNAGCARFSEEVRTFDTLEALELYYNSSIVQPTSGWIYKSREPTDYALRERTPNYLIGFDTTWFDSGIRQPIARETSAGLVVVGNWNVSYG